MSHPLPRGTLNAEARGLSAAQASPSRGSLCPLPTATRYGAVREYRSKFRSASPAWSPMPSSPRSVRRWWSVLMVCAPLPLKLDTGSVLRLHSRGGRQATAYVVFCQSMGPDGQDFRLGAQLDRPENFWDWNPVPMIGGSRNAHARRSHPPKKTVGQVRCSAPAANSFPASRDVLDKLENNSPRPFARHTCQTRSAHAGGSHRTPREAGRECQAQPLRGVPWIYSA